jgi:hypothetical protein
VAVVRSLQLKAVIPTKVQKQQRQSGIRVGTQ